MTPNFEDYHRYYHLEPYLFDEVHRRFHEAHGRLPAFDLFAIVIWKANRSKSKIARKLLRAAPECDDLDCAVARLGGQLYAAADAKERLRLLIKEWGLRLPMASAILTVLWPDDFTVYDIRVCDELNDYHGLATITDFDSQWTRYSAYLQAVARATPAGLSLREKDRWLWGRSWAKQLARDIESWRR